METKAEDYPHTDHGLQAVTLGVIHLNSQNIKKTILGQYYGANSASMPTMYPLQDVCPVRAHPNECSGHLSQCFTPKHHSLLQPRNPKHKHIV